VIDDISPSEGLIVGINEGTLEVFEGDADGSPEGAMVGNVDGDEIGERLGEDEGSKVGCDDG
jgi:hypothetical protein